MPKTDRYHITYHSSERQAKDMGLIHTPGLTIDIYDKLQKSDGWYHDSYGKISFYFNTHGESVTIAQEISELPQSAIRVKLSATHITGLESLALSLGLPFDKEQKKALEDSNR